MGQLRHGVPLPVLLSLALLCEGCGGSFSGFPPPPPAADFTLNLSSNSISITQAAASSAINVSVNPMNGFSGAVQVALNALPSGVTSNPASPFSVAAGATTLVVIAASANAATGNFTISVQGTSGALAHSASLAVAIQSAVNPALPRTAYARTDSTSASDDPFGEPHHRHLAYDSANKHLFIANRAMNRVDVFSTAGQSPAAPISIPGANRADLSADGTGAASDGTMFAFQSKGTTEIRAADISFISVPTSAELQQIPGRVLVPGVALHPSGALIYQTFLTGASGNAGVKGGIDILDAHSGGLRLRIFLPQQFMTDVDGLHGSFLATGENGQRLFAITSSDGTPQNAALTVVQLAAVPLGIGTIAPSTVAATGGATLTINGKAASVTFKDANTLLVLTPSLNPGSQQITITNPHGETVLLDAAFLAN